MPEHSNIDPLQVKAESEKAILAANGRVCDWLPCPDQVEPRMREEIVGRALVMNALLNIYFRAPVPVIKGWIEANGLAGHLSESERALLQKKNGELSKQELVDLYWYIEGLWALMWVGSLIPDLPIDRPVEDHMATLTPNLQRKEDGTKFSRNMQIRPYEDLYRMLDLYYRAHWYTEDGRINGYLTGQIDGDIIMERRKALEWVMDRTVEWDDVPLDT